MRHECRICGVELADYNWTHSHRKRGNYICKDFTNERARLQYADDPEKYKKRVMESSKAYQKIESNDEIIERNIPLVILPFEGTPEYGIVRDEIKFGELTKIFIKYDFKSMLTNQSLNQWKESFMWDDVKRNPTLNDFW